MAINWIKAMRWDAEGSAPSTELQTKGFSAGYKPPASLFNFFLNKQKQCTDQLQEEVSAISDGLVPIAATSTDGISYTATADGITELYDGLVITIKPSQANASNALTLNLNGLGAKPIRRPLSFNTYVANTAEDNFLHAETPCRLMYHAEYPNRVNGVSGKGIWLMVDKPKVSAQDLYGKTPIESGGTGADNPKDALANLGLSAIEARTTDGEIYTASCEAITELYAGLRITIIPNAGSYTNTPLLNLNELGDVPIKCKNVTGAPYTFLTPNCISGDMPISLVYDGSAWIYETYPIVGANNFLGQLPINKGGTGASTPEQAKLNLGVRITRLWANASPYVAFQKQAIEFNTSVFDEYDAYLITFGYSTSLGAEISSIVKFLGRNSTNGFGHFKKGDYGDGGNSVNIENEAWRPYYIWRSKEKQTHGIYFNQGYIDSAVPNDSYCIPWTVWGIKW